MIVIFVLTCILIEYFLLAKIDLNIFISRIIIFFFEDLFLISRKGWSARSLLFIRIYGYSSYYIRPYS